MNKISWLVLVLTVFVAAVGAQTPKAKPQPLTTDAPPAEPADFAAAFRFPVVRLWEGRAPGATGEGPQDIPTLTVMKPDSAARATHSAVIVAPGGGFRSLAMAKEGRQVGDWFAAHGVTAFVLTYRLIPAGYRFPIPFQDAQRAVRWVRAHASEFSINPTRIGMIGFSAGGTLTALVATKFDAGDPNATDLVDRVSDRPDFAILVYAGVNFAPSTASNSSEAANSVSDRIWKVPSEAPATFLVHATNDQKVPVTASTAFYDALVAAKVPAELHAFADGRHGFGLGMDDPGYSIWPMLLEAWLEGRGVIGPKSFEDDAGGK